MPTRIDPLDQPLATLIGHELEISTMCRCTRVVVFSPERLMHKLGAGVTLRTAGERLICRVCRERPALLVQRNWSTGEGRDMRVNPPALPEWVVPLLVR